VKRKHAINPQSHRNERTKTDGNERDSFVDPRKESGGKRKGRHMKRNPRSGVSSHVTMENLVTGREHGGYYDPNLKCVVYKRA
jgi:hypothetical protein